MTSSVLPVLAALAGTLAGVAATYIAARRKSSGQIRTSEAEVLWAASESIRHDLTEQNRALQAEVTELRRELAALRAEAAARARPGGDADD